MKLWSLPTICYLDDFRLTLQHEESHQIFESLKMAHVSQADQWRPYLRHLMKIHDQTVWEQAVRNSCSNLPPEANPIRLFVDVYGDVANTLSNAQKEQIVSLIINNPKIQPSFRIHDELIYEIPSVKVKADKQAQLEAPYNMIDITSHQDAFRKYMPKPRNPPHKGSRHMDPALTAFNTAVSMKLSSGQYTIISPPAHQWTPISEFSYSTANLALFIKNSHPTPMDLDPSSPPSGFLKGPIDIPLYDEHPNVRKDLELLFETWWKEEFYYGMGRIDIAEDPSSPTPIIGVAPAEMENRRARAKQLVDILDLSGFTTGSVGDRIEQFKERMKVIGVDGLLSVDHLCPLVLVKEMEDCT